VKLRSAFTRTIKTSIASISGHGVTASDVELTLESGSIDPLDSSDTVIAKASIIPPNGVSAKSLRARLCNSTAFLQAPDGLAAQIQLIENINSAATGTVGLRLDDSCVPSSRARAPVRLGWDPLRSSGKLLMHTFSSVRLLYCLLILLCLVLFCSRKCLQRGKRKRNYYLNLMERDGTDKPPSGTEGTQSSIPQLTPPYVIVVLEEACLEFSNELSAARGDIEGTSTEEKELRLVHESLMTLLESPLNRAGKLVVYLHSSADALIRVHPSFQVPHAFRRFARVIADALYRPSMVGQQAQLELVPAPVERHFPRGCSCYRLSHAGRHVALQDLTAVMTAVEEAVVYAICVSESASARSLEFVASYAKETVKVSEYEMKPSSMCRKLCHEHEAVWGICVPEFSVDRTPCNENDPLLS